MRSTESRFVVGPSNILFAGVYGCTFQPGILQAVAVMGLNYQAAIILSLRNGIKLLKAGFNTPTFEQRKLILYEMTNVCPNKTHFYL